MLSGQGLTLSLTFRVIGLIVVMFPGVGFPGFEVQGFTFGAIDLKSSAVLMTMFRQI